MKPLPPTKRIRIRDWMRVYQYRLFSISSASLSGHAGIPYDLAFQQSKISFAIQRKRETGFAFLWRKTETGARKAQDHAGADFHLHQDRDPHASGTGGG